MKMNLNLLRVFAACSAFLAAMLVYPSLAPAEVTPSCQLALETCEPVGCYGGDKVCAATACYEPAIGGIMVVFCWGDIIIT